MSVTLHVWVSIYHLIVVFVAQVWSDDISRCFFHFFKMLVFWIVREKVKGKKCPKMTRKLSHSISQELYLIWLWFLVHVCKMMISPAIFFLFFQKSDFSGFSKFINKCQKEILRCAPLSSDVFDFFNTWMIVVLFYSIKSWIRIVWACYIAGQSFVYIYVFHKFTEMFVKKFLLVPHCYSYKWFCCYYSKSWILCEKPSPRR